MTRPRCVKHSTFFMVVKKAALCNHTIKELNSFLSIRCRQCFCRFLLSDGTTHSSYQMALHIPLIRWHYIFLLSDGTTHSSYQKALHIHLIRWHYTFLLSDGTTYSSYQMALHIHLIRWHYTFLLSDGTTYSSYQMALHIPLIRWHYTPVRTFAYLLDYFQSDVFFDLSYNSEFINICLTVNTHGNCN